MLRARYSQLARRYYPHRKGGDRRHDDKLQRVVEAYQVLRKAEALGEGVKVEPDKRSSLNR